MDPGSTLFLEYDISASVVQSINLSSNQYNIRYHDIVSGSDITSCI